jgi:hypothetical protein
MSRVAAAAALATVPLALAACGGVGTPPPPKAGGAKVSFHREAAAICAGLQRSAAGLTNGRKPTDADLARLLARSRAAFDRLARLEPPPAHAKPFGQMLAHYRHMTAALAAMQASDDESVLADAAGAIVEGTRGSRAARRAGLPGCALLPELEQPPHDPQPVLTATRALVPQGARVVTADTSDCNKLASCRFQFASSGSTKTRLRSVLATLRSHGWRHVRTGRSPTGTHWATAYRNDYQAELELLGERAPPHCAGANRKLFGCSDSVWVHRVEIPEVLRGG